MISFFHRIRIIFFSFFLFVRLARSLVRSFAFGLCGSCALYDRGWMVAAASVEQIFLLFFFGMRRMGDARGNIGKPKREMDEMETWNRRDDFIRFTETNFKYDFSFIDLCTTFPISDDFNDMRFPK